MNTVIFKTQAEAETQQAIDLVCWMKHHSGAKYIAGTTRYATPRLRLDGDWDYTVCPHQDYTDFTLEEYSRDNYAQPEGH